MNFSNLVSAHNFRWNIVGRVNAIGVHAKAPKNAKNDPNLFPNSNAITTVSATMNVLYKFFNHFLSTEKFILPKIYDSIMMLAG